MEAFVNWWAAGDLSSVMPAVVPEVIEM